LTISKKLRSELEFWKPFGIATGSAVVIGIIATIVVVANTNK
jgi:hypothetical protein